MTINLQPVTFILNLLTYAENQLKPVTFLF